jgi:hypothetical protein
MLPSALKISTHFSREQALQPFYAFAFDRLVSSTCHSLYFRTCIAIYVPRTRTIIMCFYEISSFKRHICKYFMNTSQTRLYTVLDSIEDPEKRDNNQSLPASEATMDTILKDTLLLLSTIRRAIPQLCGRSFITYVTFSSREVTTCTIYFTNK